MKTKIFTLLFAVAASVGTMFAEKVKIGGLYYNLDGTNQTAEVTSQNENYPYWSRTITTAEIPASAVYNSVIYSVTSIGEKAFLDCDHLTSITIPNSVTSIGEKAFSDCDHLTSITIPNSVTSIGESAFNGCTSLTSIEIPNSVTSIGDYAFSGCTSLTSITIPNSVTSIGDEPFSSCTSLTAINVSTNNPNYCSIDGALFSKDGTTLIRCPAGKQGGCTIPNSVTSIGRSAFSGCTGLTSIEIPNSVTSIGESAFFDCTSLSSIEIPNSINSIGDYAFQNCTSLRSVTIPNSVTSIGRSAFFGCTGLTSIEIPNSVTSIGAGAFFYCTRLTSIGIPNSINSIGDYAFSDCRSLTDIYVACGDLERVKQMLNNDSRIKYSPYPLYTITQIAENGYIETISKAYTCDEPLVTCTANPNRGYYFVCWSDGNKDNPRTIELTQDTTMEAIFDYLLTGKCGKDSALTWTLDTKKMALNISGKGALSENFTYGSFIKSLTIGSEVTSIGQFAFSGCKNLKNVVIGSSVKVLEEYAFYQCQAIETITCYSQRPPTVNNYALYGLDYSTIVYVPAEYLNTYIMHDAWGLYDVRPLEEVEEPCLATNQTIYTHICSGDSIEFGGRHIYASGTYVDSLLQVCGEDSIVTLVLNVTTPSFATVMDTIEQGEIYHFGKQEFTQQGIYKDTLQSVYGCDSAYVTLILFVEPAPTYKLNVVANNARYGVAQGGGTYSKNAKTILTATPSDGCRFIRWSDGNTENPRAIIVTSDSSFTAFFAVIKYNIVAEPNDPMLGVVNGGGEFLKNEKATLMVKPFTGSRFTQWSDGNNLNPRTVTVTSDSTFSAIFVSEMPVIPETTSDTMYFSAADTILRAARIYSPLEIKAYDKLIVATTDNHHIMGATKDHYCENISYTPLMNASDIAIVEVIPSDNYFRLKTSEGYLTPGGQNRNALYAERNGADWKFVKYKKVVLPQTVHYNDRMILYNEQAPRFSSYRQVTGLNRYQTTVYRLIAPIIIPQEPEQPGIDSTLLNEYEEVIEDIPAEVVPEDTMVVITTPYVEFVSSFTVIIWADAEHTKCVAIVTYTPTGQIVSVTYPKVARRATQNNDISLEIGGLLPETPYYYTLMACDDDGSTLQTVEDSFTTMKETPSDIQNIHSDSCITPTKLLHEGNVYILRGSHIYTITGQEVR